MSSYFRGSSTDKYLKNTALETRNKSSRRGGTCPKDTQGLIVSTI